MDSFKIFVCIVKISYVYRAGQRLSKYIEKRCKDLDMNFEGEIEEIHAKRIKLESNKDVENNRSSDIEMEENLMNCTEER